MTVDSILSRIQRVKKTGPNRWLACCPAHGDKSPSLSIRQTDQGVTLLHCFAGCTANEVMASIGLRLSDLYPERINPPHGLGKAKPPFNTHELLFVIHREASIVFMCAGDLVKHPLLEVDKKRLVLAMQRIDRAIKYSEVRYG